MSKFYTERTEYFKCFYEPNTICNSTPWTRLSRLRIKVLNRPIQMYQRKTVGHLPVGTCFTEALTISLIA